MNGLLQKHVPAPTTISESNDLMYAICQLCDSNIESWWYDGDDDRTPDWTAWGSRIELGKGIAIYEKYCTC